MEVDAPTPAILAMLVGGLTASIALERVGKMGSGQTILITGASGGTGHFAVQLAKLRGCKVVGTCSSDNKVRVPIILMAAFSYVKVPLLHNIGCDRVINYSKEDVTEVLQKEFPAGVDIVLDTSADGALFEACAANLAVRGKLILLGQRDRSASQPEPKVASKKKSKKEASAAQAALEKPSAAPVSVTSVQLQSKSASVRGFFLSHYTDEWPKHFANLQNLVREGKLSVHVDPKRFEGLESVFDAMDHLMHKHNVGKVVVQISSPQTVSRL